MAGTSWRISVGVGFVSIGKMHRSTHNTSRMSAVELLLPLARLDFAGDSSEKEKGIKENVGGFPAASSSKGEN